MFFLWNSLKDKKLLVRDPAAELTVYPRLDPVIDWQTTEFCSV
jgi:hypothetical protein